MRLNPLDPQRWVFYGGLAHAHFSAGRYEEAVEWADRALHAQPRMIAAIGIKAAACAHLGRIDDAGECVNRFCELRPGSTIGSFKRTLGRSFSPEVLAAWVEGLRKAGLPEK